MEYSKIRHLSKSFIVPCRESSTLFTNPYKIYLLEARRRVKNLLSSSTPIVETIKGSNYRL